MIFDVEKMFQLVQAKNWLGFLDLLYTHKSEIKNNILVKNAIEVFLSEYFSSVTPPYSDADIKINEKISLFHRVYAIPDIYIQKSVGILLIAYNQKDNLKAYSFAVSNKEHPYSQEIIDKYIKERPILVTHNRSESIKVTKNQPLESRDFTIPLFKSEQEYNFFQAVVASYPNYHTYPNVAVSCLIDYDKIKEALSDRERNYFFKAIVDCVVFDSRNKYVPKYFFEVDSSYHDSNEQKEKDKWKDNFFTLAGKKLYRVRPLQKIVDDKIFIELIRTVVEQ